MIEQYRKLPSQMEGFSFGAGGWDIDITKYLNILGIDKYLPN